MATPDYDVDSFLMLQTPVQYRIANTLLFVTGMGNQTAWLNGIFNWYKTGSGCDFYDVTVTYSKGNRASTIFGVYESLSDGNVGNSVSNTTYWLKILDSFIGAAEQAKFSSKKIVFEYALNRHFGTTFRQYTNDAYTHVSDIYITTDTPAYTSFIMSAYGVSGLSYMFPLYSTGIMYDPAVYTAASTYQFTIHMPAAYYATLGVDADNIIRSIADRIAMCGTQYSIATY